MVELSDSPRTPPDLTEILKAASDPSRREILTLLAQQGPTRVTEIAARFEMSLNAVSKHIKVLESAGLVSRRTLWREHLIEVRLEPLSAVDAWFRQLRSIWDLRLEALETLLTEEPSDDRHEHDRREHRGTAPDPGTPDQGAGRKGL